MRDAVASEIAKAQAALARGEFAAGAKALQALALAYPHSHLAQHTCGAVLSQLGAKPAAEPFLRRALALAPGDAGTKFALGVVLLAQEKYAEGWALYEAMETNGGADWAATGLPYPEWRGEPLEGRRLLVWPDQGYGDQILFIRYVRPLLKRGHRVVVCCSLALERLFAHSLPTFVAPVLLETRHPDCDVWIRTSLLASRLGLRPQMGPKPPYLSAPEVRRIDGARIGVVTRGNPDMLEDKHRSLWPDLAQRLLALPGAVSLLPEDTGASDFADTAAIIAGLDLVITVDTSVAHLAGAMGKPVWILLPTIGLDWRYGVAGDRTPWHPTARLFRQPRINDWPAVVDAVEQALREEGRL